MLIKCSGTERCCAITVISSPYLDKATGSGSAITPNLAGVEALPVLPTKGRTVEDQPRAERLSLGHRSRHILSVVATNFSAGESPSSRNHISAGAGRLDLNPTIFSNPTWPIPAPHNFDLRRWHFPGVLHSWGWANTSAQLMSRVAWFGSSTRKSP